MSITVWLKYEEKYETKTMCITNRWWTADKRIKILIVSNKKWFLIDVAWSRRVIVTEF